MLDRTRRLLPVSYCRIITLLDSTLLYSTLLYSTLLYSTLLYFTFSTFFNLLQPSPTFSTFWENTWEPGEPGQRWGYTRHEPLVAASPGTMSWPPPRGGPMRSTVEPAAERNRGAHRLTIEPTPSPHRIITNTRGNSRKNHLFTDLLQTFLGE